MLEGLTKVENISESSLDVLDDEVAREGIRALMSISSTEEVADEYAAKYSGGSGNDVEDYKKRIIFLEKLFDIKQYASSNPENVDNLDKLRADYWGMLTAIINIRWG